MKKPILLTHASLSLSILLTSAAMAGTAAVPGAPAKPASPNDAIVTQLFDRDQEESAFAQAVLKARAAKVNPELILEARLIRAMGGGDKDLLVGLLPELERAVPSLDPDKSRLFNTKADAQGLLDGLRALHARQTGDAGGFQKSIQAAFWEAPALAEVFGRWTAEFQHDQRMAAVVVPMNVALAAVAGQPANLKQVLGGNKALLLDFWASWCGPCMESMPELRTRAVKLAAQGVVLAGINTESDAGIAARVKQQFKINTPWLVEPTSRSYSKLLEVDTLPHTILINAAGKILYDGHPSDPALKTALAKLGVRL